jgi:hypothetical protein
LKKEATTAQPTVAKKVVTKAAGKGRGRGRSDV